MPFNLTDTSIQPNAFGLRQFEPPGRTFKQNTSPPKLSVYSHMTNPSQFGALVHTKPNRDLSSCHISDLPVEILANILKRVLEYNPSCRLDLMLVSEDWEKVASSIKLDYAFQYSRLENLKLSAFPNWEFNVELSLRKILKGLLTGFDTAIIKTHWKLSLLPNFSEIREKARDSFESVIPITLCINSFYWPRFLSTLIE